MRRRPRWSLLWGQGLVDFSRLAFWRGHSPRFFGRTEIISALASGVCYTSGVSSPTQKFLFDEGLNHTTVPHNQSPWLNLVVIFLGHECNLLIPLVPSSPWKHDKGIQKHKQKLVVYLFFSPAFFLPLPLLFGSPKMKPEAKKKETQPCKTNSFCHPLRILFWSWTRRLWPTMNCDATPNSS